VSVLLYKILLRKMESKLPGLVWTQPCTTRMTVKVRLCHLWWI